MKFSEWRAHLGILEGEADAAEEAYNKAAAARDSYLRETVGFAPGDKATIVGTAELVSHVLKMLKEEGE